MKKLVCLLIAVVFLLTAGLVCAEEKRSSAAQAKMWVEKGAQYAKEKGVDAAVSEFNNPKGAFVKDDLFIMAINFNTGEIHAYPPNHKLVKIGSRFGTKDADGKPFIKTMADLAKTKGEGWVDYKYLHPIHKNTEQKTSYVKKISDDMFIACGAYK